MNWKSELRKTVLHPITGTMTLVSGTLALHPWTSVVSTRNIWFPAIAVGDSQIAPIVPAIHQSMMTLVTAAFAALYVAALAWVAAKKLRKKAKKT